ncbi:MAG: 3-keto-disaccharide hydrolase [Cyclobacteriaceae bacterium]
MISTKIFLAWLSLFLFATTISTYGQDQNPIQGRWDLVIAQNGKELPSWLEIYKSGSRTLVGRFVYASGSARPIAEVKVNEGKFSFSIPPQWEEGDLNMEFEGRVKSEGLEGTMRFTNGKTYNWTATRAPKLAYNGNPNWGKPIKLFNGTNLSGWHALGENQWIVEDGILKSPKSGANLVTDAKFTDFKLHVEFRYPKGSNSGIYLRGRYEVQIEDGKGREPSNILFAGIYGFLAPNEMAAKDPGEWQEFDITLIGSRVTIVANGMAVITAQNIPGITGGALDSNEGEPGPIFIQGDHGPIEFRSIAITPVME